MKQCACQSSQRAAKTPRLGRVRPRIFYLMVLPVPARESRSEITRDRGQIVPL